jgi:outer membrane protein assembly factor BamC
MLRFQWGFRAARLLLLLVSAAALAACGSVSVQDEEGAVKTLPPLEVPPDLVKPTGDSRLKLPTLPKAAATQAGTDKPCGEDLPRLSEGVLPPQRGVHTLREGQRRWLVVEAEPEQVWPLARKFLASRGYRVARDEPAVGLLETDWKPITAEAGGDKTAVLRERLRLRLEPGERPGMTEVHLSQNTSQQVDGAWQMRAPDEDRAIIMLNRFAQYLGGQDVRQAVPLSPLTTSMALDADGNPALRVEAPFEQVWRRTALGLEALGFTIEDHDRSSRTYSFYNEVSSGKTEEEVKYGKPESARVRDAYQVKLTEEGDAVLISLRNKKGEPEVGQQARHLLNLLQGQFQ